MYGYELGVKDKTYTALALLLTNGPKVLNTVYD